MTKIICNAQSVRVRPISAAQGARKLTTAFFFFSRTWLSDEQRIETHLESLFCSQHAVICTTLLG